MSVRREVAFAREGKGVFIYVGEERLNKKYTKWRWGSID